MTGVAIPVLPVSFFVFGNNFQMFPHHPKIKSEEYIYTYTNTLLNRKPYPVRVNFQFLTTGFKCGMVFHIEYQEQVLALWFIDSNLVWYHDN